MKKILCASLAALLVAGCSGAKTGNETTSEDAYYVFSTDVQTLDWHMSQRATDAEITANCVDALTETNSYNNYVGALAESWEANEEKTEWTFHLRDAKWVTNTGEDYEPVTADDFVAGLQHLADFDGPTLWIAGSFVEGLADYADGKTTDFSTVGVEAVDEKTVKYTLIAPTPFFNTIVANNAFWPVNRDFLESKGDGCKLGDPDTSNCGYGAPTDPSSILYNGAYIIDELVSKSSQKLHKNEAYWDAEHVYVNKISRVYNDGSDPAATVKGFEQAENPFYMATLLTTAPDFAKYLEQYKDYAYTGIQNAYSFGMNFNLNRVNYENSNKTAAQFADSKAALLNSSFRRALKFALDRVSYMATAVDPSIAEKALRTIECPWDFVTTSDGRAYGELVQAASEDPTVDLSEGQDSIYNPEKAQAELAKAKTELNVSWPIILDILVDEADPSNISQASSLEQSIEASLGVENVDIQIHPVDDDTYTGSSYTSNGPQDACWDISTSTGWGYDYVDPKSYLSIFSPVNGDVIRNSMGLNYYGENQFDGIELTGPNGEAVSSDEANKANDAAIEASGLLKFQEMIDEAYAINDDLDKRYEAEAKAEAYLLDNALYVNIQTQTRAVNWTLSRIKPFTNKYLNYSKMKGVIIQKDPVTAEEYQAAYEQWKVDKAEDAKANA
ncbi:MAG: ABC transporter substrate-binding protein [Erysipelotrichaceae bacterium]|nr:ABC transporter substrate-binding protein [Erysipelotrichaceae bacterium]